MVILIAQYVGDGIGMIATTAPTAVQRWMVMGMREILFRGKRCDNGKWVEGYFTYCKSDFDDESGRVAEIIPHCADRIYRGEYSPYDVYDVILETVGQCTGLTDKNGTKIFEGDIVDCWSEGVNAKGTVQQRKDGLWIIYPAWQKTIMWGLCPDEYCHTTVEVIGNIHDNPELLKEGD